MLGSSAIYLKEIKASRCRLTPQREAVLLAFLKEKNAHLTPYELFQKAKSICPELGLATVYRTLKHFAKAGLIREVKLEKGLTRYEFADPREGEHYHLICKRCGRIEEVAGSLSRRFTENIGKRTGFLITEYSCQFYGCCAKCRESAGSR